MTKKRSGYWFPSNFVKYLWHNFKGNHTMQPFKPRIRNTNKRNKKNKQTNEQTNKNPSNQLINSKKVGGKVTKINRKQRVRR